MTQEQCAVVGCREYIINRAPEAVPLCGDPEAGAWAAARAVHIDQFPWHKHGLRQAAEARVLYDDAALYVQFLCQDIHSSAQARPLNGDVCVDSCVEFFATVDPASGPDYFNFEANCCGAFHLGWGPHRMDRKLIPAELAKGIRVATSIPGPTKAPAPDDKAWWLAAAIPLDALSRFAGRKIAPAVGSAWRGNFYRCGGKVDQQFSCWNVVGTPRPDFHRPEFYGKITFA